MIFEFDRGYDKADKLWGESIPQWWGPGSIANKALGLLDALVKMEVGVCVSTETPEQIEAERELARTLRERAKARKEAAASSCLLNQQRGSRAEPPLVGQVDS